MCFLVLPFLDFARSCSVIGLVLWILGAYLSIVFFLQVSNLHLCCCESRVLMEMLLIASMLHTSQLLITLTSKITRFRWRILLFLCVFLFLSFLYLVQTWISKFKQSYMLWWCRWNQISIQKVTLLEKAKSLQIPSRLLSRGTKMGGALMEQFRSEGRKRMTY